MTKTEILGELIATSNDDSQSMGVVFVHRNQIVHMVQRRPKKTPTQFFVEAVINETSLLFQAMQNPWKFQREVVHGWLPQEQWEALIVPMRERKILKRLRRSKQLKDRQEGNRVLVQIARDALVQSLIRRIADCTDRFEDGQRCIVSFDVPVGANAARARWRRLLLKCGFARDQLSVWSTDRNVTKEMIALIRILAKPRWFSVIQGTFVI